MSLSVHLNGIKLKNFIEIQVERSLEAVSSFFYLVTTLKKGEILIKENDTVEIFAGEKKILTGFVDEYFINYNINEYSIQIKGRSKTLNLIDCTIETDIDYQKINFFTLCERLAKEFGIKVINNAGVIKNFQNIISPEIGQSIFNFIESLAQKRQVLLTDDEYGNLVITRASNEINIFFLVNKINYLNNNIKNAAIRINNTNRYHTYILKGQENLLNSINDIELLTSLTGVAIDNEINPKRKIEFYSETLNGSELNNKAKWELSVRRARSYTYKCTVQGVIFDKNILKINKLYHIEDDLMNIHEMLLCKKIRYSFNLDNGSETTLYFTYKDGYSL